jgi:hypothetical protein
MNRRPSRNHTAAFKANGRLCRTSDPVVRTSKPYRHAPTARVPIAWSTTGQRVRDSGDDHRRAMTGDRGKHEESSPLVFPRVQLLQIKPRSAKLKVFVPATMK